MDCLNCYFSECLHDLPLGAAQKEILAAPDEVLSKKGLKRLESLRKKQEKREEKLEKNREYQRNWYQQKKQAKKEQMEEEQMEEEQMQEEKKTEALTEEEKLAKKKAYQAEYYQKNKARLDAKNKEAKAKREAAKKAAEDQLERIQRMRSTYGLGKEKEPAAEVEEEKAEPVMVTEEEKAEPVMETARVIPAEAIRKVEATEAHAEEEEMEEFVFIEKPEETEESTQTEARKLPDTVKLEMPIGTAESLYIFLQDEILRVVKRDDVEELEWVADMCDIYRELKGVLMGK
jgi:hypothetical protein